MLKKLLIASVISLGLIQSFGELPSSAAKKSKTVKQDSVFEIAQANGAFRTFTNGLVSTGLSGSLYGKQSFTIFAPTDAAFQALPRETTEMLFKPENKEKLMKVLSYHLVSGKLTAKKLKPGYVKTVEGSGVLVAVKNGQVMINNAAVTQTNIKARNGYIHVIDRVILPPDL
ncbi:secreted/surface protein with fasciclin-like repeats [Synechococcus sp. PCC 7502]|uniref:fasciclin domain-containing protein n=1 Tax=Synechococcus sp. PCC 7502 TaxID=1173263 RepID=UPI00029FBF3C|nr:fasciclin domain-containing protein [Synechococcus sp. PCC 7502]AFY75376.1 secreted/surface protein with fasciclin-like repeats [Synechococcus sp. PCC 7502]